MPFTYSAECQSLYVRDVGMSAATAVTWTFNFILSLMWPIMEEYMQPQGAFLYYAAWNVVGFFFVLL